MGPSEKAIEAAHDTYRRTGKLWCTTEIVEAAHDPALGLDMSVCLRDVFEACYAWEHSDDGPDYVDNDIRSHLGRVFGVDG